MLLLRVLPLGRVVQASSCPACELEWREVLLPHLAAVVIDGIVRVAGAVEVWARPRAGGATCPECGKRSERVHSRYERRLADAAIGGQPVRIRLRVRRFKCAESGCARATFAEQVVAVTLVSVGALEGSVG